MARQSHTHIPISLKPPSMWHVAPVFDARNRRSEIPSPTTQRHIRPNKHALEHEHTTRGLRKIRNICILSRSSHKIIYEYVLLY